MYVYINWRWVLGFFHGFFSTENLEHFTKNREIHGAPPPFQSEACKVHSWDVAGASVAGSPLAGWRQQEASWPEWWQDLWGIKGTGLFEHSVGDPLDFIFWEAVSNMLSFLFIWHGELSWDENSCHKICRVQKSHCTFILWEYPCNPGLPVENLTQHPPAPKANFQLLLRTTLQVQDCLVLH